MGKALFVAFAICLQCLLTAQVTVPFVGCATHGQLETLEPPRGEPVAVRISAEAASELAYYKDEGAVGVLAPRGWYCFGAAGSSGGLLIVTREPVDLATFFSSANPGFRSPAIELSIDDGTGIGEDTVARAIACVFPSQRDYAIGILRSFDLPRSHYHFGPYPADKLIYKSNSIAEFETPAHTQGFGTQSELRKSDRPIRGVAVLIKGRPDLLKLVMRLPASQEHLAPAIIRRAEADAVELAPPE